LRSYELWARYVAPRFQGQIDPLEANRDWIEQHQGAVFGPSVQAFAKAFADAGKEVPEALRPRTGARG
jgi:limonene 1,2-monooxygenase